ncbi:hypothetical protein ACFL0E_00625 [Nanoarchaeota archaeon]
MNKKAVMDDMFDFLFTVMALFFILLFVNMTLLWGVGEKEELALENIDVTNSNSVLLNYLNYPIDGEGIIADLIVSAETDKEAKKKLINLTNKLILDLKNPLFKRIMIKYPSKDVYDAIYPQSGTYSLYSETEISGIKVAIHGDQKLTEGQEMKIASTGGRAG